MHFHRILLDREVDIAIATKLVTHVNLGYCMSVRMVARALRRVLLSAQGLGTIERR